MGWWVWWNMQSLPAPEMKVTVTYVSGRVEAEILSGKLFKLDFILQTYDLRIIFASLKVSFVQCNEWLLFEFEKYSIWTN